MSDQEIHVQCNFSWQYSKIKQTSDENKEKYQEGDYPLIQYQALWTEIIGIVWQIVRRITNEIMEVEGLSKLFNHK